MSAADIRGPWVFDKGKADRGMRRPGIFTSDIGDLEKVKRMRKRAEIEALPDTPVRAAQKARRRVLDGKKVPSAAVAHPVAPAKQLATTASIPGPSMVDLLALAKFERAAAKLAHAEDPEPDTTLSMSELLRRARERAGKS